MMNETLTPETCWEYLKAVIDPEIFENIVDLGLVYDIEVAPADAVVVNMTLTTPHCPMGPQIIQNVQDVLAAKGASTVDVNIVWEPMWTPDAMTDDLKRKLGILEYEEPEPEPVFEIPPPPPKPAKKGFFGRLFGG